MHLNPELDLELVRIFAVPPALVWRCWTEPALICQWFCPKPWSVSQAVVDLRAGGRFFTMMRGPDGETVPNEGSFLEVVTGQKLVFTDLFAADFAPIAEVQSGAQLGFSAIVTFDPEGAGTRYRAVVRHRTPADAEKHKAMGFHDGWGAAATQLEELAKTL
ncbi:MAG: SRPBCC family protein [Cypionkella sp.]